MLGLGRSRARRRRVVRRQEAAYRTGQAVDGYVAACEHAESMIIDVILEFMNIYNGGYFDIGDS